MLRGVRPFLSDKYDLTKHPNYKYTADADKKYLFDMEQYMNAKTIDLYTKSDIIGNVRNQTYKEEDKFCTI